MAAPFEPDPTERVMVPLDLLAEEYARRFREGEEPTIEEFERRYPDHSGEIRRMLETIEFLERGKMTVIAPGSKSPPGGLKESAPFPQRFGDLRVVRELGRGGMGIVFEAVEERLGRKVAVKVLPRHALSDEAARQRFFREARAIAKLQHPNIVPIYSLGEQDDVPFFVMRLIDGQGLDRLASELPERPLERARRVAELGRQAALALAYAHSQDILHRDIKPANILLDSSGTVWLADFGLAKLSDDLTVTGTGELPGTLRYIAPECLNSEADERSDIYSLGLTLYELAVGRPAFTESNRVRLLVQIESHKVVPPKKLVPELPRDLESIILKATAREPSARYATAEDFADDLERFLDGRPVSRRATVAENLVRWSRRNPLVAALSATSLILAVVAFIFIRLFVLAPPPPPDPLGLGPRGRPPGGPGRGFPPPEFDPEFPPPPFPGPPPPRK